MWVYVCVRYCYFLVCVWVCMVLGGRIRYFNKKVNKQTFPPPLLSNSTPTQPGTWIELNWYRHQKRYQFWQLYTPFLHVSKPQTRKIKQLHFFFYFSFFKWHKGTDHCDEWAQELYRRLSFYYPPLSSFQTSFIIFLFFTARNELNFIIPHFPIFRFFFETKNKTFFAKSWFHIYNFIHLLVYLKTVSLAAPLHPPPQKNGR